MKLSGALPEPVKAVVHLGSRSYGRLTAEQRMLPSFLICGGQRCGTTSMYRALAAHPAVLKAVLHKGVHYFDVGYDRGLRWYRGPLPDVPAGRADRARPRRAGADVRVEPVLHVPPARDEPDRHRPARR